MNRAIVFSGFNQRAVIAILRAFEINGIEDYVIVACGNDDPVFLTAYSDKVRFIRKHRELYNPEIYDIFRKIVSENDGFVNVVVPSTEGLNRFLIDFRAEIEEIGITVPLVNNDLYRRISDKRTFWEICQKNGLAVPQIIEIGYEFKCRYVAKPKTYISPNGERYIPQIILNSEDHKYFLDNYNLSFFDIQEYIDGQSIYLLYYLAAGGQDYAYSQINLVQQPGGKSMIASLPWTTHNEAISRQYLRLIRDMGYTGFIMIELRKNDNGYIMIEANPRMWGPSQLCVDAHVPFIEAFLHDYGIIEMMPFRKTDDNVAYFWGSGIKDDLMKDKSCVWLESGRELVEKNLELILASDIYDRDDTRNYYLTERYKWGNK